MHPRASAAVVTARSLLLALALLAAPAAAQGPPRVLDDFEPLSGWVAAPSDGVSLRISADSGYRGQAMRLDFDFHGGGGYAVARKAIPIELPENYRLTYRIRGDAPRNNLEFKLVDPSGDNVWWVNRRDMEFPDEWTEMRYKKRHVEFAWGPTTDKEAKRIAQVEFAVTAGQGGKGTVWIDELALVPLPPAQPYDLTPRVTASSARGGAPAAVLDGRPATAWRSAGGGAEWLALDFLRSREYGGLVVTWDSLDHATDYTVQTSDDGRQWATVHTVAGGDGGRDYVFMPEAESRHVRLQLRKSASGRGYALRELAVQPLAWSASKNDFLAAVAKDAPRGSYPRYLTDSVQTYWTVLGVIGDAREGMLNTDGLLETGKGQFSIEPFLRAGDRLLTWADVRATPSLEKGYLPIPSATWDAGELGLTVTAFAAGAPDSSLLFARYRVANRGAAPARPTLYLALRPFQVNPTWQFLNTPGGAAPLRELGVAERPAGAAGDDPPFRVTVNGERTVIPLTPAAEFGAATFDQGNVVKALRQGTLPRRTAVQDPLALASGALAYPLEIPAGGEREVWVAVPLDGTQAGGVLPPSGVADATAAARLGGQALRAAIDRWERVLGRTGIQIPDTSWRLAETIKSNVAYILINRDGPAIQPGSRSYERSWIRDGALTSAALLRLGHHDFVREFIEWYAPFQYPNGKVPCCVDHRGADPVPEHDSHGELIYLIAEYVRLSGDTALGRRMWPHVVKAVAYIDTLRQQRRTAEYRTPENRAYFGIVPQSISHEGYAAKPMHSYWDNAFTLRGLKDAAWLAAVLGHAAEARRFGAMRDEFRTDMMASYRLAMQTHGIDFLPGSVELGDFDATSTTVAVAPGGELAALPRPALERTFERYWEDFVARRDGRKTWEAYTPYEHRVVGTMVRLGWRERAHEVLDWFMGHRRPQAWNHWAEVVFHDPATPKFVGDMPHTWVGSDFIRSVLDFLAYEREADSSLVVGAGVREEWLREPGVRVDGLRTSYGPLSVGMVAAGDTVRVRLDAGVRVPPGGIVVRSPRGRPARTVTVDGRVAAQKREGAREVTVRRVPAEVVWRY